MSPIDILVAIFPWEMSNSSDFNDILLDENNGENFKPSLVCEKQAKTPVKIIDAKRRDFLIENILIFSKNSTYEDSLPTLCFSFNKFFSDDLCRYHPEAELPEVEIEVNRLEKELFKAKEVREVEKFLQSHEQMAARMFHLNEYPNEKILAERIFGLVQNDFIDTLYAYPYDSAPKLVETMNNSLGWLKYYFPEMTVPKIQTMVSGLYNDLAVSKDLIIIGLDFFIGEKASYRPKEVPQYILRRYEPKYMTPTVLKFFISDYCSSGDEETLLSEMIDYGKIYYSVGKHYALHTR